MRTISCGLVLWIFTALSLTGTTHVRAAARQSRLLTVIGLTDFHGALEPTILRTSDGESLTIGGAALLASYVKIVKSKAKGPVIVIDAGDLFQGTLESNLAEGAPVIKFYNALGVDAAALGNHEFDYGPAGIEKSVAQSPKDDPRGALKKRAKEAQFPFLAANVFDDNERTPNWIKRSIVINRGGVRVGVVGAATPSTPSTTVRANLVGLRFDDPTAHVEREARELREKRNVDVVVLTMHGGGGCEQNGVAQQDDLSSCKDEELFRLLRKLPEGLIDVAVGGHTHQGMAKRLGRTVVLQSYAHGQQVAWAEVPVGGDRSERSRVAGFAATCGEAVTGQYGPTCNKFAVKSLKGPVLGAKFMGVDVTPDKSTLKLISPAVEQVRKIKQRPLGVSALTPLTYAYGDESALGNMVADLMRAAIPEAVIGLTNNGGLRSNVPDGPLTYGHVFSLLPFDNRIAKIQATGALVRRIVEHGVSGPGGGLSWSGLSFSAKGCQVEEIRVGDKAVDPDAIYLIATSDYLASGGGGFDRFGIDPKNIEVLWNGPYALRDVVANAISAGKRDLRAGDYFDAQSRRQRIDGKCPNK